MTCPFKPMCVDKYECHSCRRVGHKAWCGIHCPEDGCGSCTCNAYGPYDLLEVAKRRRLDLWGIRTTSSGRFEEAKKSGDVLGGARREDSCSIWDSLDTMHRSLLALLGLATVGLILHALGVFCG
jgi:hypothetical protein